MVSQLLDRYPKASYWIAVSRLDKPIGIYLLLWPTLWALWIAAEGFPGWHLLGVFVLGTVLTRSAGCVINDVADRNFDGQVERTVGRPLVTGELKVEEALMFMGALLTGALVLVLTTNWLTILLAFFAALVAGLYPFMKRYTYLPQVVLGVAFSFGIPMSFAAVNNDIPQIAWLLVTANVLWTVAYDTEYAMVDREDDLKVGIKSTAILFGDMDKMIIAMLQLIFVGILLILPRHIPLDWMFYAGVVTGGLLLTYQQHLIRNRSREGCFKAFQHNHWVGLAIFIGILSSYGF